MKLVRTALLVLVVSGCETLSPRPQSPAPEILALLAAQTEAWNRGDLEAFMAGYESSPRVSFSGANGTMRGWDAILERYGKRYPDRQAMGKLAFSSLDVTPLGDDHALVLGEYRVEREGGALQSAFSLVLVRNAAGWRIIHDHTTAFPPSSPE